MVKMAMWKRRQSPFSHSGDVELYGHDAVGPGVPAYLVAVANVG